MTPGIPDYKETIFKLMEDYKDSNRIYGGILSVRAGESIKNAAFLGSKSVVSLTADNSIIHTTPAFIAAPLVTMIAKNAVIFFALDEQIPVRFYVPSKISITTKHLVVGNVKLLVEPNSGYVTCEKLTLVKSDRENPDQEIIESWITNDYCEIETVRQP